MSSNLLHIKTPASDHRGSCHRLGALPADGCCCCQVHLGHDPSALAEVPGERDLRTRTLTLDVGEWGDLLSALDAAARAFEDRGADEPEHPRGRGFLRHLQRKVRGAVHGGKE